ncbi:MAG: phosphomannomutase/phosphoglucomutase [Candidatus Babeliales bacterium]
MQDSLFRQYDIRGIIDQEWSISDAYAIGCAIAVYMQSQKSDLRTVALAMDGRIHSASIKELLVQAFVDSGIDVIFIGLCPTPVLYFALHQLPVDGGLMITASHNGPEYNGIKMCLGTAAIAGAQIQAIKELVHSGARITAEHKGVYSEHFLIDAYVAYLVAQFAHLKGWHYALLIDCGNGATGAVLPQLIRALQWPNASLLFDTIDGTYPNHEADPTVAENMVLLQKEMGLRQVPLGIGFDGDGDRMAPLTQHGELVFGDKLLALFAQEIVQKNRSAAVVYDIKCSAILERLIQSWGGSAHAAPSGHSNIKKMMAATGAVLAGELSCHFFFKDRYFGYDDGIYAMLRLCEILSYKQQSLDELLAIFPKIYNTPELRIACQPAHMPLMVEAIKNHFTAYAGATVSTIDGVRVVFPFGWGLIRASNTQPVICLRFEAESEKEIQVIQDEFAKVLTPFGCFQREPKHANGQL